MTPLADALAHHVDAGDIPGAVAVVAVGDDVEITVLGHQAIDGDKMRPDSLFRIASAGKPITAAAVLALIADGNLALDEPVDDLLPELSAPQVLREPTAELDDTVPAACPITVADLLRCTNGHGLSSDLWAPIVTQLVERLHQGPPRPRDVPPPDDWMTALSRLPLLHQPGSGFTYNTAYDILGVLVHRASGQPFADYLSERILRPLGMIDTGFVIPAANVARATSLYRRGDRGDLELVDSPDGQWATTPSFASGAGGYVSTASDVYAFLRMLTTGGGDVLPGDLVAAMMTDQLTPEIRSSDTVFLNGQSWGYGGGVDITVHHPWNVPGRYGWVGGTGTSAYTTSRDESVAILLTQVELMGPGAATVLETFWDAAADQLGHGIGSGA